MPLLPRAHERAAPWPATPSGAGPAGRNALAAGAKEPPDVATRMARSDLAVLLVATLVSAACTTPRPLPPDTLPMARVLLYEPGVENAYPRLSRDGRRLLYQSDRTGRWQLFVMDLATKASACISDGTADDNFPDWSADGAWVAFVSNRDGNEEIYRMRSDGSGVERLTTDPARDIHPYFSPDGEHLLFNSDRAGRSLDVWRLALADRSLLRMTDGAADETCARYAPDMRSFVMLANDATQDDVFVVDVATARRTNLTATPYVRDGWPAFDRDGAWIYFSSMVNGRHCVHRIRTDGAGLEQLTTGGDGIEDGRAAIGDDGRTLVWNRRHHDGIAILWALLPS